MAGRELALVLVEAEAVVVFVVVVVVALVTFDALLRCPLAGAGGGGIDVVEVELVDGRLIPDVAVAVLGISCLEALVVAPYILTGLCFTVFPAPALVLAVAAVVSTFPAPGAVFDLKDIALPSPPLLSPPFSEALSTVAALDLAEAILPSFAGSLVEFFKDGTDGRIDSKFPKLLLAAVAGASLSSSVFGLVVEID